MSVKTSELLKEIKFLAKKRRYVEAASMMEEYISLNQYDNYSLVYYVMLLNKTGNYKKAKELSDKLLNEEKLLDINTRLFLYSQRAHLMANIKDYEEAIRYFNLVIDNSKFDELEARTELARIYFMSNNTRKCFDILTLDDKKSRFLSLKKATFLSKIHKYKEAIKEIEDNKDIAWDKSYGFNEDFLLQEENYVLGDCFMHLKDYKKALEYLSKACNIKSSRNYFKAYYDVAYIKNRENKNNEAIEILKRLLNDKNATFMKYNIHSELGKAYLKKADLINAEKQFKLSSDEYGQRSFLLAKLECSKGNFDKAEEYIKKAKQKASSVFPEMYYFDVLIKFRNMKYEEAYKLIENVSKTYFNKIYSYSVSNLLKDLHVIKLLMDKELEKESEIDETSYIEKQISNYSIDNTVNYIKENNFDTNKLSYFKNGVDIDSVILEVQEKLDDDIAFKDSTFDKYIVSYENIGLDSDKNTLNQLMVITFPNTKNIVGMYPFDASDNINYTKEGNDASKKKVYRMSQIDKFKLKYGDKF